MPAYECMISAWRANCLLKFKNEHDSLHCNEFTKDRFIDNKSLNEESSKQKNDNSGNCEAE
ncbi:MAG: hypothetical protein ACN4E2_07610 [Nitrospinota bacterium]